MATVSVEVAYVLFFVSLFGFSLCIFYSARHVSLDGLLSPGLWLLSARKEIGWGSLGLSLYASFMGNWVLYLPALAGSYYGWAGVIGYSLSSCLPYILLLIISPYICNKKVINKKGLITYCSCDYLEDRLGTLARSISACISISMMFLSLSSELTTIGLSISSLADKGFSLPCAVLFVAFVPLIYVGIGGVTCSIISDVAQALVIVALFIPLMLYLLLCFAGPDTTTTAAAAAVAAAAAGDTSAAVGAAADLGSSITAAAVLILSIWPTFLCDQGIWQRLWASRSIEDMQLGLLLAAFLAGASVLLFGAAGSACIPLREQIYKGGSLFSFAATYLPQGWTALLCVLAVACVTSSVDTYQVAAVSVIGREIERRNSSFNWARLAMLLINIPAIIIAVLQLSLMRLFMAANFLCAILSGPFLLSIHPKVNNWGFIGGLITSTIGLLLCAIAAAAAAGESFSFAFFVPDDISSLPYLVAFIVAPLAGAAGTALFSFLDIYLGRRKAAAKTAAAKTTAATAAAAADKPFSDAAHPDELQQSQTRVQTKENSRQDDPNNCSSNNRNLCSSNSNLCSSSSSSSSCQVLQPPSSNEPEAQVAANMV